MIASYNNGISHKPSIIDSIVKLGVKSAPLVETLGSKPISSYLHSWISDRYRDPKDNARLEVSDFVGGLVPTKTKTANQCQILTNDVDVSKRQQDISQYGEDELPYQRAKVGIEHVKDLEYALLGLGNTTVFDSPTSMTATVAGRMAGLFYFVPEAHRKNYDTDGGDNSSGLTDFTFDQLQEIIQPVWEKGGVDDGSFRVYMGSSLKNKVNKWLDTIPHLRTVFKDGTVSPLITKIETDFGTIDIYLHRLFAGEQLKDKILLGKFDEAKICYLTETALEDVASSKTATLERYYTDATLEITNADYFACASGLK